MRAAAVFVHQNRLLVDPQNVSEAGGMKKKGGTGFVPEPRPPCRVIFHTIAAGSLNLKTVLYP